MELVIILNVSKPFCRRCFSRVIDIGWSQSSVYPHLYLHWWTCYHCPDNELVTEGTETVLNDPVTAIYQHRLSVTSGGEYRCSVTNQRLQIASQLKVGKLTNIRSKILQV